VKGLEDGAGVAHCPYPIGGKDVIVPDERTRAPLRLERKVNETFP
jgi:hypothetical protein